MMSVPPATITEQRDQYYKNMIKHAVDTAMAEDKRRNTPAAEAEANAAAAGHVAVSQVEVGGFAGNVNVTEYIASLTAPLAEQAKAQAKAQAEAEKAVAEARAKYFEAMQKAAGAGVGTPSAETAPKAR